MVLLYKLLAFAIPLVCRFPLLFLSLWSRDIGLRSILFGINPTDLESIPWSHGEFSLSQNQNLAVQNLQSRIAACACPNQRQGLLRPSETTAGYVGLPKPANPTRPNQPAGRLFWTALPCPTNDQTKPSKVLAGMPAPLAFPRLLASPSKHKAQARRAAFFLSAIPPLPRQNPPRPSRSAPPCPSLRPTPLG